LESNLFVIGAPRSGTTLLTRVLAAHSAILGRPEPHLITPLAHLGYYASVEKAPYDPINVRQAIGEFVRDLPRGEDDYLDALRAYTNTLYTRMLAPSGKRIFLDKTPAYALVLDFLTRLYPDAYYIVLTRNPMAIWSSYVKSFFDGDFEVAHAHNPLLERYLPAMGRFLRDRPVERIHQLRYEDFVEAPDQHVQAICSFLEIPFEADILNYAAHSYEFKGLGDPLNVDRQQRPVNSSVAKWTSEMAEREGFVNQARQILEHLLDEDLEIWGYSRESIRSALDGANAPTRQRKLHLPNRYLLERKILIHLRRNIHQNALGKIVRKIRFMCDVLLR